MVRRLTTIEGAKEKKKVARLLKKFNQEIATAGSRLIRGKGEGDLLGWDESSEEQLLQMRKRLAGYIKEGMLERRDMEAEIALVAAMVWYLRQEAEKQWRNLGGHLKNRYEFFLGAVHVKDREKRPLMLMRRLLKLLPKEARVVITYPELMPIDSYRYDEKPYVVVAWE